MVSKKTGVTIFVVGLIVGVLGGGGTFGYLYYQAVNQIEIEIDHIYVTDSSLGGTILNPTIDVDLEIHASISNPTSIAVEIEYVMFELYFDGVYYGNGQTSSFAATQTPSPMVIETLLDNIGGEQYLLLFDLIVLGNSKVATVRITTIKVWGFAVELNLNINQTITQSDIL
ncbi:MAG: hypothetical protein ACTSWW_10760 [Promethearchaeota archaeon]